ncbi:MAG: hypothetical protein ACOCQA_03275 [bacterium]
MFILIKPFKYIGNCSSNEFSWLAESNVLLWPYRLTLAAGSLLL